MAIRNKFNEFKKEIRQAYDTDENQLLEMSHLSVDELVQSGYFHRRIESFVFLHDFDKQDIVRFFNEECADIDGTTLGAIEHGPGDETIADFIHRLRLQAMKCKLWFELIAFLSLLKGESIRKN